MSFVKIDREIINSEIYADDELLAFYVRLLLQCRYKAYSINGIDVGRGQIFTSIRKLASVLNLNPSNTFKLLSSLEEKQIIRIEKYTRGSLITLINYECNTQNNENLKQLKKCLPKHFSNTFEGSTLFNNKRKNVKNGVPRACENQNFENQPENSAAKNTDPDQNSEEKNPALNNFPTRDSLIEKYGEDNVFEYECRFERWKNRQKKPVNIGCYEAIERWMRDDRVEKKLPKASSEAAFDTDEIIRRVMENYNR